MYSGSLSALALLPVSLVLLLRLAELISVASQPAEAASVACGVLFLVLSVRCTGPRRVASVSVLLGLVRYRVDLSLPSSLDGDTDLSGIVVVITGASSGIGLALAEKLAARRATLILGCRNLTKCAARKPLRLVNGANVSCVQLDLSDLSSVAAFAEDVRGRVSRVDFLVNNAGMIAPPGQRSAQGLELSFQVMHLAHFFLTRELWPLLQKPHPSGTPARVINHASAAFMGGRFHSSLFLGDGEGDLRGEVTDGCIMPSPSTWKARDAQGAPALCPLAGAYSRAKLAQVLFTQELAARAAQWGGRETVVATLHPGTVRSGIVQVSDLLVRPTAVGARVLEFCMFANFTSGSYIDDMLVPHDLSTLDSNPKNSQAFRPASNWFSLPLQAYSDATEKRPVAFRRRLWEVSDALVKAFASRTWPTATE
jgi:NAD(P)-dependent dehydrogenase (short-subunit alcohol dehydrogenase family)